MKPLLRGLGLLTFSFLLLSCVSVSPTDAPAAQPFGLLNAVAVGLAILGIFIGFLLVRRRRPPDEPPE